MTFAAQDFNWSLIQTLGSGQAFREPTNARRATISTESPALRSPCPRVDPRVSCSLPLDTDQDTHLIGFSKNPMVISSRSVIHGAPEHDLCKTTFEDRLAIHVRMRLGN